MTKFEMAKVIFDAKPNTVEEAKALSYSLKTDKETVTRMYNRTLAKMNNHTALPCNKFEALRDALYKQHRTIYCQAVYNTCPVEFQVCWGGKWGSVEEAIEFADTLKERARLAKILNDLKIVVEQDSCSRDDYQELVARYSKMIESGWIEMVGEDGITL